MMAVPWLILVVCVMIEVVATMLLTKSEGFARPLFGIASLALYGICFLGMSFTVTRIPVGIAYAVWAGAGVALVALTGWLMLRQPLTSIQIACIALIVVGAVGLNLTTKIH